MGRPLALALAAVAAFLTIALLDERREISQPARGLTAAATEPEPAPQESSSEPNAAVNLADCLASVSPPARAPVSPPLTPRGIDAIAERVARLRELRFDGSVDVELLSGRALNREVSRLIDGGARPGLARRQGTVLELLGAIPPRGDLLELTRSALDSQVLGLFVPETERLLVSTAGDAGAVEAITLAHELEHALVNDALGLPVPERSRRGRGDRDLAALALVEGDATLTMQLYALRYVALSEQLELLDDPALASGEEELDELPHILRAQLLFPYERGLEYVCSRFARGGWAAVDRAYASPPSSTAELLDPSAGRIAPVEPPPLAPLASPWRRTLADGIGAAELSFLFEAPGDDLDRALPDPAGTAADWRGGAIELWRDGERAAVGLSLAQRPGGSLCGAIVAWYGAAFPEARLSRQGAFTSFAARGQAAAVACVEEGVRLGIGPDAATARRLAR